MSNSTVAERLLGFVVRIEQLEDEKKGIAADLRDVKKEARAEGFDVITINQIIRERRMDADERRQHLALLELYRASLGMLGDTPLGNAAIERLQPKPPEPPKPANQDGEATEDDADAAAIIEEAAASPPPPPAGPTPEEIAAAREEGRVAGAAGKLELGANPYPARDPRRAAWDEGWCMGAGSDGMEIPEAWRRTPKPKPPKKGDDEKPDENAGDDDDNKGED